MIFKIVLVFKAFKGITYGKTLFTCGQTGLNPPKLTLKLLFLEVS